MKKLLSILAILGFSGLGLGLTAVAQNQSGRSPSGSAQRQPDQEQVDTQSARSYEGKIEKAAGKLVLHESSTREAYLLDDQEKARQFEGQSVKVMATMDPNTNTLHVVDISPADKDK